jgi:CRP/FNR family transcriptional regulator, cyclic AMP receptor protein
MIHVSFGGQQILRITMFLPSHATPYTRTVEWKVLGGVPDEDIREVLAVARRRTFRRGEVVFHRGDPADSFHLVTAGRFAVRATTPLGETTLLSIRGPGEAFGELALIGGEGGRSATVSALEPGETRAVFHTDFDRLRLRHPGVNAILVSLLADDVRRLSEHLSDAYYLDAEERVRRRLGDLAEIYGGQGATIPLTQEDVAGYAGTSRVTANRVLRQEQERGSLALQRGQITILDASRFGRRPLRAV